MICFFFQKLHSLNIQSEQFWATSLVPEKKLTLHDLMEKVQKVQRFRGSEVQRFHQSHETKTFIQQIMKRRRSGSLRSFFFFWADDDETEAAQTELQEKCPGCF
ncbi:hypothetical protein NL108_017975 [Boleophthalmus pectinirostris]|nr:hypothetical protein NL108_017975 [Boleophthalmus pectinirostris]